MNNLAHFLSHITFFSLSNVIFNIPQFYVYQNFLSLDSRNHLSKHDFIIKLWLYVMLRFMSDVNGAFCTYELDN